MLLVGAGSFERSECQEKPPTSFSNTELKPGGKLDEFVSRYGAQGLAWMKVEGDKLTGSTEKFLKADLQKGPAGEISGRGGRSR